MADDKTTVDDTSKTFRDDAVIQAFLAIVFALYAVHFGKKIGSGVDPFAMWAFTILGSTVTCLCTASAIINIKEYKKRKQITEPQKVNTTNTNSEELVTLNKEVIYTKSDLQRAQLKLLLVTLRFVFVSALTILCYDSINTDLTPKIIKVLYIIGTVGCLAIASIVVCDVAKNYIEIKRELTGNGNNSK